MLLKPRKRNHGAPHLSLAGTAGSVRHGTCRFVVVLSSGVVKVTLSGGTDGTTYKVTATLTTVSGLKKEAEIKIKVKET